MLTYFFRDQLILADPLPLIGPDGQEIDDTPSLPVLPAEFLRGTPINTQPKPRGRPVPESISGPVLILNENGSKGGTREPVNIPLPNLITTSETVDSEDTADPRILQFNPVESLRSSRFREFVDSQPDPIRQHFIVKREMVEDMEYNTEDITTEQPQVEDTTLLIDGDNRLDCSWNIKVRTTTVQVQSKYMPACAFFLIPHLGFLPRRGYFQEFSLKRKKRSKS